jgi:hypothetical protein
MKNPSAEFNVAGPDGGHSMSNQLGGGNSLAQQLEMIMNSGNLANLSSNISALGLPNLTPGLAIGDAA